jgi:hypothetical protein
MPGSTSLMLGGQCDREPVEDHASGYAACECQRPHRSGVQIIMCKLQLLKMIVKEEHFVRYTGSNPDTMEGDTDHPAGMIAHILQETHGTSEKVLGYECKVSTKSL